MQLPNLKGELIYCGKNERHDCIETNPTFHIMTKGEESLHSIHPHERVYLLYTNGSYSVSPANQPTSL